VEFSHQAALPELSFERWVKSLGCSKMGWLLKRQGHKRTSPRVAQSDPCPNMHKLPRKQIYHPLSIGVKRKEQFLRKLFLVICQAATSAGPNASLETGVDATSYKTKCANVANLHLLAGWLRTRMSPSS
jgi:hypothetical protein